MPGFRDGGRRTSAGAVGAIRARVRSDDLPDGGEPPALAEGDRPEQVHRAAEIGGRLGISPGTARVHIERILGKLGLTSRVQIATWIVRNAGPELVRSTKA